MSRPSSMTTRARREPLAARPAPNKMTPNPGTGSPPPRTSQPKAPNTGSPLPLSPTQPPGPAPFKLSTPRHQTGTARLHTRPSPHQSPHLRSHSRSLTPINPIRPICPIRPIRPIRSIRQIRPIRLVHPNHTHSIPAIAQNDESTSVPQFEITFFVVREIA